REVAAPAAEEAAVAAEKPTLALPAPRARDFEPMPAPPKLLTEGEPAAAPRAPEPKAPDIPPAPEAFNEPRPTMRDVGPEPPAFTRPRPKPPTEPQPAARAEDDTRPFADRLKDATRHLDTKPNGKSRYDGLVPMSEIRKEFPELSKEEFDNAIREAFRRSDINMQPADRINLLPEGQRSGVVMMKRHGSQNAEGTHRT